MEDASGGPRREGPDIEVQHPGAPRREGQGNIHEHPGAPRREGQGNINEHPGAPRREGQGDINEHPGVPRRKGRGGEYEHPGAPRREGRGGEYPGVSRREDRGLFRNNAVEPERHGALDLSRRSVDLTRRSVERERSGDRRANREREPLQRTSRRRRRHLSLSSEDSEDSGERYHPRSKRARRSSRERESNYLNQVLSILDKVKSSNKPKLPSIANVIPEFDPMAKEQTVLTWLTKVEECAEIYEWNDKETTHYALLKLTGVAKSWYQGLPSLMFTWSEWKRKLIESFPCREDYAELLTEMLAKRACYGESLEHYYYSKVNLLNRCKIYGRQAVDCILHGVEDRAARVGAQAAQFAEPEQILKYFRTVKSGPVREKESYTSVKQRNDNILLGAKPSTSKDDQGTKNVTCYNCSEVGHRSTKCNKPAVTCSTCNKVGHQTTHCFRNKFNEGQREKGQQGIENTSVEDAA